MKPLPESGTTYGEKSKLMRESGQRMAVRVAVVTATRDVGRVMEYNRLLAYHDENSTTSLNDRSILG